MKKLVIDRQAIKANYKAAVKCTAGAEVIADLSGDAYGLGLLETARVLRNEGVHCFAVSEAADARLLRERGFTEERLMMLRSTADREELEELIDLGVVCTVGSNDAGMAINSISEQRRTITEVQIAIDVGGGSYGFPADEVEQMCGVYKNMNNLAVVGAFTVLSRDGAARKLAAQQLELFNGAVDALHVRGYETGMLHAISGVGLMHHGAAGLDAVRIGGMMLAGRLGGRQFVPVGSIEATIEELCWYSRGSSLNGRTLKKAVRLAIVSVGSSHGYGQEYAAEPANFGRALLAGLRTVAAALVHRRRWVKLKNGKAMVYGRVQLMHTAIDVSKYSCAVGDLVIMEADPVTVKGLAREYR